MAPCDSKCDTFGSPGSGPGQACRTVDAIDNEHAVLAVDVAVESAQALMDNTHGNAKTGG